MTALFTQLGWIWALAALGDHGRRAGPRCVAHVAPCSRFPGSASRRRRGTGAVCGPGRGSLRWR